MRFIVVKTGDDGKTLRVDLQGLRGFGVLLVIIGHLWLWPRGAFGALDIFFVLSGFFISEILIDQFKEGGTLRFREFYLARARRLAPTALTVIAVTLVLTRVLFSSAAASEVDKQGFWAAVFGSNWYFIETSNDYFANLGNSPMVHYWSLSVEEQFYVAWPLLIWITLRAARRRGWNASYTMFVVFGLVTAVSFAYSMWHSTAAPISAYYSTFDRVWEFGIGGLVAAARPWFVNIPARVGTMLSWVMGLSVASSIFIMHYGQPFPAPWGLLPVLPTAGLIAAGVSGYAKGPFLLTNVPMVYLGTISYSFYLWHLPVNYLLRSYFIEDTTFYKLVALAVSLVVSVLSFHLLERPMRRARWLMTRRERRRLQHKPPIDLTPVKVGWAAVLTVVAATLVVMSLASPQSPSSASAGSAKVDTVLDSSSSSTKVAETAEQRQIDRVDAALRQSTFPSFDPPLSRLKNLVDDMEATGCTGVSKKTLDKCRFGDPGATKHAMVLGDSTSVYYMPGIREALVPKGWSVQQFTRLACPAWTLKPSPDVEKQIPGCVDHTRQTVDVVRAQRPDLLILTTGAGIWVSRARTAGVALQGADLVSSGLGKTLKTLKPYAKKIVILESPPGTRDLRHCVTRFSTPNDCKDRPTPDWYTGTEAEQKTAEQYGAGYIPVRSWFCDGACPAFMGSTPVTADGAHLTIPFSRSLAPVLRNALLRWAG